MTAEPTPSVAAPDGVGQVGPPPPFDPELAAALELVAAQLSPGFPPEAIPAMREGMTMERPTNDALSRDGFFDVEERSVPGPEGAPDISLLICRPRAVRGPLPGLYYTHGGGMILGHNRLAIEEALDWAQELGMVLVSVEYRLAPEHPYPAPVEDCYAGLRWAAEHAQEVGIDPERILVAGASAGGGLTAAVALLARDRGGPSLIGQVLISPMLDDRNDSYSCYQMAGRGLWDRMANETGWGALLGAEREGRTCRRTRPPHGPPTCPGCRSPTSTSARPRPSATRPSTTPCGSGERAGGLNSMCGRAGITGSTRSPRRPSSPRTRWPHAAAGCGGF